MKKANVKMDRALIRWDYFFSLLVEQTLAPHSAPMHSNCAKKAATREKSNLKIQASCLAQAPLFSEHLQQRAQASRHSIYSSKYWYRISSLSTETIRNLLHGYVVR